MNDPHVESLRYRLEVDEVYGRFENPPALDHETDAYRLYLENGVLTVEMKEHHPTAESARRKVEPDLKAWELNAALSRDHTWLKFVFDRDGTRIVDRNPTPPEPGHVRAQASLIAGPATMSATCTVTPPAFKEYPRPPRAFEASLEVEVLFDRYQRAIWDDESHLLTVGYVCLSFLERTAGLKGNQGARGKAAQSYRIDQAVLKKLGNLVSKKGDIREARKLDAGATLTPLTQQERLWVRAVIRTLIRRKAEYDYDPGAASLLPQIMMTNLPPL